MLLQMLLDLDSALALGDSPGAEDNVGKRGNQLPAGRDAAGSCLVACWGKGE